MNVALLVLDDVACVRGGRLLFEGLSLRLAPGETALVTGPNGAGKSSLIRVAAGLLPATGTIERSEAALADELPTLDPRLSLRHALGFWAQLDRPASLVRHPDRGAPATARDTIAALLTGTERAMEAMGLTRLASVPVRMLSAGQRKRAALARILASGAPLWLLDEPANGLDADGLARLDTAMATHRAAGGAILAASHQPLALAGAKTVMLG